MGQLRAGEGFVSGQDTLSSIERSISDLMQMERNLRSELETVNGERSALMDARVNAFRELAEVRARNALADGVIDEADRLSQQITTMLAARMKAVASLKRRLDKSRNDRQKLLEAHETLAAQIAALEAELDKLAEKARRQLARDPAYKEQREKLEHARAVHDKAVEKAEKAKADRASKGAPYENDPLFMYLWRRRYGTKDYTANRVIRWLDGKVAWLVGYSGARANYAMLLEIPVRLEEHVARLAETLQSETAALEALEAEKVRELADRDLAAQLGEARASEAEQNAKLEQLAAEITDISNQLNLYAQGLDHGFRKAVEMTADFLEQQSLEDLRQVARVTPSPSDDQIVQRVTNIDLEIEEKRERIDHLREELQRLFRRKEELMRIAADFRRSHYDDPGSVFVGQGTAQHWLEELLRGAITAGEYWARTRRSHRWRSRPADSYRHSSSLPPFGGSRRGSRGPDFRTGGGF